jgi:micrococcal nuclease
MTRITLTALLAAALVVGCEASDSTEPPAGSATIARVADGDTLVLRGGERVRLLQIDAPGDLVRLEPDPALDDRDRHGRLLRYVHAADEHVNVELVRRGAAAPFFFRGERGAYAEDLLAAVENARRAGAGMWSACEVRWRADRQVETRGR